MPKPLIHGTRRFIPASKMLEVAGESLRQIKEADDLSWKEVGEAIGKSEDQAAKYAAGLADMPMTTFLRCIDLWNGRFANSVMALLGMTVNEAGSPMSDLAHGKIHLMQLLLQMEQALLDGEIKDDEIEEMASAIEMVGGLVDSLRKRLAEARAARAVERIG